MNVPCLVFVKILLSILVTVLSFGESPHLLLDDSSVSFAADGSVLGCDESLILGSG